MGLAETVELEGPAAIAASAREVGLIDSLARHASPEEHAHRLGLDPEATRLVLEALATLGLVEQTGDRFGPATTAPGALDGSSGWEPRSALWSHLPRFLRTGERFSRMDGSADERAAAYKEVVPELASLFEGAARRLAAELAPATGEILDVGAGSGVWSLAMCEASPGARVTAVDLPDVLAAFHDRTDRLGLARRVESIPGDYQSVALPPRRFDRVVLANVLHLEPPERARALIVHVAPALRSGGELVVVDALAEGNPAAVRAVAVYAVHLAMRTASGRVHPGHEIEGWCREAGLGDGELVTAEVPPWLCAALVHRAP